MLLLETAKVKNTRTTAAFDNAFWTSHTSFRVVFALPRCGTERRSRGTAFGNYCATLLLQQSAAKVSCNIAVASTQPTNEKLR